MSRKCDLENNNPVDPSHYGSRQLLLMLAALCLSGHANAATRRGIAMARTLVRNRRETVRAVCRTSCANSRPSQGTTAHHRSESDRQYQRALRWARRCRRSIAVCTTYGPHVGSTTVRSSTSNVLRIPRRKCCVFRRARASRLTQLLQSMQVPDKRFALNISDRDNTVYVSGTGALCGDGGARRPIR